MPSKYSGQANPILPPQQTSSIINIPENNPEVRLVNTTNGPGCSEGNLSK